MIYQEEIKRYEFGVIWVFLWIFIFLLVLMRNFTVLIYIWYIFLNIPILIKIIISIM